MKCLWLECKALLRIYKVCLYLMYDKLIMVNLKAAAEVFKWLFYNQA